MSLLVLNSSSKIAQGVIRHLHKTGKYEQINCADLYPNYWGVQSQVNFLHSVDKKASNTKLIDTHISDKIELERAVKNATHVLYITHDYYTNVASKTNLITNAAKTVLNQYTPLKSFVALTPGELDHYGEPNPQQLARQSELEAQKIAENLVNIKADLTFGKDSVVLSQLVQNLQQSQNITFQPSANTPAPIHVSCLAVATEKALESGNTHAGKTFLAEGQKRVSWNRIINLLENSTGTIKELNSSTLEKIASPLSNNLLSEYFFRDTYRNAVQYINQYQNVDSQGTTPISELGVNPIDFETTMEKSQIKRSDFSDQRDLHDQQIKQFIY